MTVTQAKMGVFGPFWVVCGTYPPDIVLDRYLRHSCAPVGRGDRTNTFFRPEVTHVVHILAQM